jgi:hypothetical protein
MIDKENVLGRNLEQAAGVMGGQLVDILGRTHGQIEAHPRPDGDLLDAGQLARAPVQANQRAVVGAEVGTNRRIGA